MRANNGYAVNFASRTFTMTKAFEQDLLKSEPKALATVKQFQELIPNLRLVRKTHRHSSYVHPDKGLTYANMERYIRLCENSKELLAIFQKVKDIAATQKNSYLYTRNWFAKQFPDFQKLPDFEKGKLYIVPKPVQEEKETELPKVVGENHA